MKSQWIDCRARYEHKSNLNSRRFFMGALRFHLTGEFLIFVIIWWLIKNLFIYIECIVQTGVDGCSRRHRCCRHRHPLCCRRRHRTGRPSFSSLSFERGLLFVWHRSYLPSSILNCSAVRRMLARACMCNEKDIFSTSSSNFFNFYAHSMPTHASNVKYIPERWHRVHKMWNVCVCAALVNSYKFFTILKNQIDVNKGELGGDWELTYLFVFGLFAFE